MGQVNTEEVQMQKVEFVMAKSPEQLAQEAREAALLAFQSEAATLLFADYVLEEATERDREPRDYTRTIQLRGDTWVFTYEGSSMRALQYSGQPADRILRVTGRGMEAIDDSGNDYLESHVGINVTALFKGKRAEISSLVMTAANENDLDTEKTLDVIMKHGEFKVEWPNGVDSINLTDLYLLLRNSKVSGQLMINPQNGQLTTIQELRYNPESMYAPEHVTYTLRNTIAMGGQLVSATINGYCKTEKIGEADLPFRPANADDIAKAIKAGKELYSLMAGEDNEGFAHVQYKGIAYTPGAWGSRVPHVVNSRVVVDAEGLRLMNQNSLTSLLQLFGLQVERNNKDEPEKLVKLKDEDLACLAPVVIFFNLERSCWMAGSSDNTQHINFREDAFGSLVLDPQRKRLVEALVVNTNDGDAVSVDIIDGKGGGAIFLLDGPPGTGKTLTAEATAEKLKRTLYKVGLGELGTNAQHLEAKLAQVLNTARRWNAVLLLDEADVFLEKRSTENLERNAMVAVFLRLLEYYNGILFLTTNRGDNFDPAVISRVTLALHFKRQDLAGRATIWTNLLKNAGVTVSAQDASYLADLDINGREIKNAINSSRALAKADGIAVNYTHIREIVDSSIRFETEVKREEAVSAEESFIRKLVAGLVKLIK